MAKATTFLATDPSGVVHTRTSKTRTYTHCTAFKLDYARKLADARRTSFVDKSNYEHHVAGIAQSYESWIAEHPWRTRRYTDDQNRYYHAQFVSDHVKHLRGATCLAEYLKAIGDERAAEIERLNDKGHFDQWFIDGWQGRPDLAPKALASLRNRNGDWFPIAETAILPATVKGA